MTSRSRNRAFCVVFCAIAMISARAWAQEPAAQEQPKIQIDWQDGPTTGKLGDIAEIEIPQGYRFADKAGAEKVLQLTQNLPSGRELGVLVAHGSSWFMIFEFEDSGYVKDNDKLDADAILKSMQEGTEHANAERSKRGWKPLHVTGWQREPFYDPQTHNLTWASVVRGDAGTQDDSAVNHSVRILGRRGTMNVDLVASTGEYVASTDKFNEVMAGFHFTDGNRYSDFRKGDKVAELGLTALIVGGGAAVALKTGLLAKLWKFILVGILALVGAIKKAWRAIFGKEERIEDPNQQAASQGQ